MLWKMLLPYPSLVVPCYISEVIDYVFWEHWQHQVRAGCQANTLTGTLLSLLKEAQLLLHCLYCHKETAKWIETPAGSPQEMAVDAFPGPTAALMWYSAAVGSHGVAASGLGYSFQKQIWTTHSQMSLELNKPDGSCSLRGWLPAMGTNSTCTPGYLTLLPFRQ